MPLLEWVRPTKDWQITYLGKNEYSFILKDKYIGMTGANVITEFTLLRPHKLKKIEIKHTDSAKAESTDNLKITFQRRMERLGSLLHDIYEDAVGTTASDIRLDFNGNFEFPSQTYRLTLNTTSTDRAYLEIFVELLPKLKTGEPSGQEVSISPESILALAEAICACMPNKNNNNNNNGQYPLCGTGC